MARESKSKPDKAESEAIPAEVTEEVAHSDEPEGVEVVEPDNEDPDQEKSESDQNDNTSVEEIVSNEENTPTTKTSSGFFPMLLGGVVTAALGFGVAQYMGNDRWPFGPGPSQTEELAKSVALQADKIVAVNDGVSGLKQTVSALPTRAEFGDISDLQADAAEASKALTDKINAFERRLADLENRPIPEVGATVDAVKAYEKELGAMRKMFEAELARVEAAQVDAISVGKETTAKANEELGRASLTRIEAALDSGSPFSEAVAALESSGVDVPSSLMDVSADGVPSLSQLQTEFPDIARAVLRATNPSDPEAGQVGRIAAFFRNQVGARSLTPREGNDPDAILSRAEAALSTGDVGTALKDLAALPPDTNKITSSWIEAANARQSAIETVATLTTTMNE